MEIQDIKIYHITHVDNLSSILAQGGLLSDSEMRRRNLKYSNIGYINVKGKRLYHPIHVAAQGYLGDYVPFNFCNRSVMLYVIYRKNLQLLYQEGQEPIVHLVSDLRNILSTCNTWFFSDRHAVLGYAIYYDNLNELGNIDFEVMKSLYWNNTRDDPDKEERRQAEFLVHNFVSWNCITEIGVYNESYQQQVTALLKNTPHQPVINVHREWYY